LLQTSQKEKTKMSIIIISSDIREEGENIAEKTAKALGYALINRSIIPKISEKCNLPPGKLEEAMDKPAGLFLGMSAKDKMRYLAYMQAGVLSELKKDNCVCQGLLGHLYVLGVSHALKVKVLPDTGKHVKQVAEKEKISEKKAYQHIMAWGKQRQQQSLEYFRVDETDPSRYDLTISLSQIDPEDAVKIIAETVSSRKFMPMTYSVQCMVDLALAAEVRASLVENFPNIRVKAENRKLIIETFGLKREKRKKTEKINALVSHIPGVEYFEVHFINDFFKQAAGSFR
jgi:cytidylate kinase